MKLSKEREKLVLENWNLIYYCLGKLKILPTSKDYEDFEAVALLGLVKAASKFDKSQKVSFSTYACESIKKELFNYFERNVKKHIEVESLNADLPGVEDWCLEDVIEDERARFEEEIEKRCECCELISIILNYLDDRDRMITLYRLGGLVGREIGEELKLSRMRVSQLEQGANRKIYRVSKYRVPYRRIFSWQIGDDQYELSFPCSNIEEFERILRGIVRRTGMNKFDVKYEKGNVSIKFSADPKVFIFVEKLIEGIKLSEAKK